LVIFCAGEYCPEPKCCGPEKEARQNVCGEEVCVPLTWAFQVIRLKGRKRDLYQWGPPNTGIPVTDRERRAMQEDVMRSLIFAFTLSVLATQASAVNMVCTNGGCFTCDGPLACTNGNCTCNGVLITAEKAVTQQGPPMSTAINDDGALCNSYDSAPDSAIPACTRKMASGKLSGRDLAVLYNPQWSDSGLKIGRGPYRRFVPGPDSCTAANSDASFEHLRRGPAVRAAR